jgi:hypothetical protein
MSINNYKILYDAVEFEVNYFRTDVIKWNVEEEGKYKVFKSIMQRIPRVKDLFKEYKAPSIDVLKRSDKEIKDDIVCDDEYLKDLILKKWKGETGFCTEIPETCTINENKNVYYDLAMDGNISGIIKLFLQRYHSVKENWKKNSKTLFSSTKIWSSPNVRTGKKFAAFLYIYRTIFENTLFKASEELVKKLVPIDLIKKSVSNSALKKESDKIGKEVSSLSSKTSQGLFAAKFIKPYICFKLLFPYRMWKDPSLNAVMLILARIIKKHPETLQKLAGYDISIKKKDELDDNEIPRFVSFKSKTEIYGDEKDKDHSAVLNMIFEEKSLSKFTIQKTIANTLHTIIVSSALFEKDKSHKDEAERVSLELNNPEFYKRTTDYIAQMLRINLLNE